MKLNIGCGNYPILKQGWLNLDKKGGYQKWEFGMFQNLIQDFDIEKFPWRYEKVDCIVFSHVLNQIQQHDIVYAECYKILRKGGVLRIIDDDNGNSKGKYYDKVHEHTKTKMIPKNIIKALLKIGFKADIVDKNITTFEDRYICVDNHLKLSVDDKFFLEAVK
jgi:predicted SAM-dependent methyltransferase